jgi:hypothetical protein
MKKIFILAVAMFLLLVSFASAEFCDLRAVQFFGECNIPGDVVVKDSQNNVIVQSLYSQNSGCYNGIYSVLVSGGPSAGCILQENELIAFYVSGSPAATIRWSSSFLSKKLDLSTNRTFVDVSGTNISVTDEIGSDVENHGSGGGGGGGEQTYYIIKKTPSGPINISVVNMTPTGNDKISADARNNQVYVNVSNANEIVMFVPAPKATGTVVICLGVKSFADCIGKEIKLEKGATINGVTVESAYKVMDGKNYYVVTGLKDGVAKEAPGSNWFLIFSAVIVLVFILIIYLIIRKRK